MKKLNAQQTKILNNAIASEQLHGVKKPITVCIKYRSSGLEGHSKSFSKYCRDMWELIDANLIKVSRDGFAYVI